MLSRTVIARRLGRSANVLLWQLRQCTKVAEDLNRELYYTVSNTVPDALLRNKLQKDADGDLVTFLLNCRQRFGNNPAQLHISHAQMYGELVKFTKADELSEQIKRWLDYQRDVDPNVFRLATVLNQLTSGIY